MGLLWVGALLTPRPPELMVLNEPETSLHPELLPALARLIARASQQRSQVWRPIGRSAGRPATQDRGGSPPKVVAPRDDFRP